MSETWKDGELIYVYDLLEAGGNKSVPRGAIQSYLRTQVISAMADRRFDIALALVETANLWHLGHYGAAKDRIRMARVEV